MVELALANVPWQQVQRFKTIANLLIYASIILGVALLAQLFPLVPTWLFYSVLAGWVAYLAAGIAVFKNIPVAYYASVILAFLTLAVSLPRPEHYSFGLSVATITFLAGSMLQVGVILSVTGYLLSKKRISRLPDQSS